MKKTILQLSMLLALLSLLTGCKGQPAGVQNTEPNPATETADEAENTEEEPLPELDPRQDQRGQEPAAMMFKGNMVLAGDILYRGTSVGIEVWQDGVNQGYLYPEAVHDIQRLNLYRDTLYYIDGGQGALCRLQTDGTGFAMLEQRGVSDLNVVNDILYYNCAGQFYQMRLDGSEKKAICTSIEGAVVAGSWIYYKNNDALYRKDLRAENETLLWERGLLDFQLAEDQIYYTVKEQENDAHCRFYRMKLDGSEAGPLFDAESAGTGLQNAFAVYEDFVYYFSDDQDSRQKHQLKRIALSGGPPQTVVGLTCDPSELYIVGESAYTNMYEEKWIFIQANTDGSQIYAYDQ